MALSHRPPQKKIEDHFHTKVLDLLQLALVSAPKSEPRLLKMTVNINKQQRRRWIQKRDTLREMGRLRAHGQN